MTEPHVIAVDLGSSGVHVHTVPVERPWDIAPGAERRYRTVRPGGGDAQRRHFNAVQLRAIVFDAIASALQTAGLTGADVSAVSVTAQRGSAAFLDASGRTIYVGPNTDLRAVFEGAEIDDRWGDLIYARTGHLPSMLFTPAKLHWWRRHHPRIARRIAHVASLGGWLGHELTGDLVETPSLLVAQGLADVTSGKPAVHLLHDLDIAPEILPATVDEGTAVGVTTEEASAATGLRAGTPVYLAGPDTQSATLGAGCAEPGATCIVAGWSAPVQRVARQPVFDAARRTWTAPHLVPGRWVAEANPGDTGRTVDAVRRLLGNRLSAQRFDELVADGHSRTNDIIAAWGPRALNLSAPGMSLGGLLTPVPVTYDGIDRASIAHATLENVAFAIRECVSLLDEVAPVPTDAQAIALTGGMAGSRVFARMLAEALGRPVRVHHARAAASGATLSASRTRSEWTAAAGEIASHGEIVEPAPSAVVEAEQRYHRWLKLREGLDALAAHL